MNAIVNQTCPVSMREIATHLFLELREQWDTEGEIPDGLLRDLLTLFPSTLLPALDLVDHKAVIELKSTSGRCIYQVAGISEESYCCLLGTNYCPCTSFQYSVLTKDESIMCKHLLAVHISIALGLVSYIGVTNQALTESLVNM